MNDKLSKFNQYFPISSVLNSRRKYFPSIYRIIPESIAINPRYVQWIKIGTVFSVSALFLSMAITQYFSYQKNRDQLMLISSDRQKIEKEITDWKTISEKYPNYSDVYLKLAALEYRLGNSQNARTYVDKALSLNPQSQQGRVLGSRIGH